jgi:hypothetical protein
MTRLSPNVCSLRPLYTSRYVMLRKMFVLNIFRNKLAERIKYKTNRRRGTLRPLRRVDEYTVQLRHIGYGLATQSVSLRW